MERMKFLFTVAVTFSAFGLLLQGCISKASHTSQSEIHSIKADTTVYLTEEENSPTCKISMDFNYIKSSNPADSITNLINAELMNCVSENKHTLLSPDAFVKEIVSGYITDYKSSLAELYEADKHNIKDSEELPGWYNYEYDIDTEATFSMVNILNYCVTTFQNTGGAHPNTFLKWININMNTGKILTKDDVFISGKENEICQLILKQLIGETNKRMETDAMHTAEDLQEYGILLDSELYIPDYFRIENDGITFLYNRYDIAPYSMGDFQLTVPYTEIKPYLHQETINLQ